MGRAAIISIVLLMAGGCTSRWAMNDAKYAAKYGKPYRGDEFDKLARMAKQSIDARHVAGKGGIMAGTAIASDPGGIGAEFGGFRYGPSWLEGHASLAGLATTSSKSVFFGGLDGGLRLQTPSRFAPFAGAGGYVGFSPEYDVLADNDGINNDDDHFTDEPGETREEQDMFAAIYPEVGAHLWLTSQTRVTASAKYYFNTEGRDSDFAFYGITLGWLFGGGKQSKPGYLRSASADDVPYVPPHVPVRISDVVPPYKTVK